MLALGTVLPQDFFKVAHPKVFTLFRSSSPFKSPRFYQPEVQTCIYDRIPPVALSCAEDSRCKTARRHRPPRVGLRHLFTYVFPLQLVFHEPKTCMRIFLYANSLHFQDRPGNGKKREGGEGVRGRGRSLKLSSFCETRFEKSCFDTGT